MATRGEAPTRRRRLTFAYNTNGFAHHRLDDVLHVLKRLGYHGVALTADVHHLDPASTSRREITRVRRLLERLGLTVVVETGARYVLDPLRKHHPSLLSRRGWRRRHEFLLLCLDMARGLGAPVVSLWSGAPDAADPRDKTFARLAGRCRALADAASHRGLRLGFEPEPGMFIARTSHYRQLRDRVDHPAFGLTLDLGHLHCLAEQPIETRIQTFRDDLVHVHIEDMVRGVHEHLPFGRGEMDHRPLIDTLLDIGYRGQVAVELSRDGHRAVEAATESIAYLRRLARRA